MTCAQNTSWKKANTAGLKALDDGRYVEAELQLAAALKMAEAFGEHDHRLGASLNNLAEPYLAQGKYAQAEPLSKRALAIREMTLGPEHPTVAEMLDHYANLLRKMDRAAEAAKLKARPQANRAKLAEENPTK